MSVKGLKVVESYEFDEGDEIPVEIVNRARSIMFLMRQHKQAAGDFGGSFTTQCSFRLLRYEGDEGFQITFTY